MNNNLRKKIPLISLIIYLIGFLLIQTIFSPPGYFIILYLVLAFICFIPILLGNKVYRIIGCVALAIALIMISKDYYGGIRFREKIRRIDARIVERYIANIRTNSQALNLQSNNITN